MSPVRASRPSRSGIDTSTTVAPNASISSKAPRITLTTLPALPSSMSSAPTRAPSSAAASSASRKAGASRPSRIAVAGSAGSIPTVASSAIARSVAVRASGPPVSCECESGRIPSMLDSPFVGRSPKRLCTAAGMRIEPQVSVPQPTAAKLAATAAPVPPELPPGLRAGS